ncbi:MAG: hypothetical protein H0V09_06740, partial [Gemmatimonadetes bacterium]|nr:hypothetical protein [Gemmatimonadota bacterium]
MTTDTKRVITFDAEKMKQPAQRRAFLHELALAAGALAIAPAILRGRKAGSGLLAQQGGGETEDLTDTEILNYALTLEYLEA